MADFLKGLPSRDSNNFSRFQSDAGLKPTVKKTSMYISTKDFPSDHVITTERTNILLRYLHRQWDKQHKQQGTSGAAATPGGSNSKRDASSARLETSSPSAPKQPRLSNPDQGGGSR